MHPAGGAGGWGGRARRARGGGHALESARLHTAERQQQPLRSATYSWSSRCRWWLWLWWWLSPLQQGRGGSRLSAGGRASGDALPSARQRGQRAARSPQPAARSPARWALVGTPPLAHSWAPPSHTPPSRIPLQAPCNRLLASHSWWAPWASHTLSTFRSCPWAPRTRPSAPHSPLWALHNLRGLEGCSGET